MSLESQTRLVIVGAGMATGRLLDELMSRSPDRFDISVVGDEPEGSYNRIMLSPVLAGEAQVQDIIHKDPSWFPANKVHFYAGRKGTQLDTAQNQLTLDDGTVLAYDHLVLATGSRPSRIPADNQVLAGIFEFRTLKHVEAIAEFGSEVQQALVVGGGLLGLEAAYGLAQKGLQVTLVHRSGWPLNRQLDAQAGAMLRRVMEDKGIQFVLDAQVTRFDGLDRVQSAVLNNGQSIPCQLVVIATGITPNKELGVSGGLQCDRGVCVDAHMTTSAANVSAIGECCEFEGETFGLVEPIWHQCKTLAQWLCDGSATPFINPAVATKLKVSGVQVFSAGDFITQADHREIVLKDESHNVYRKILMRHNQICGAVLFGDTRDGMEYFSQIQSRQPAPKHLASLTLGKSFQTADALVDTQPVAVNQ